MIERRDFATREEGASALVRDLATCLNAALSERNTATLALSGGRTPETVLPLLGETDLEWDRVTLTLADERWVPASSPNSNEGLVRRTLLQGTARKARFSGLTTADATPHAGAPEIERRLAGLPWPLDGAFLGMGEDGHVASLFPDDPAWYRAAGRCVAVPQKDSRLARMSLTASALLEFRRIFLVLFGAAKRSVFERALQPGPETELPVRIVLHQDRVPVTVYLAD